VESSSEPSAFGAHRRTSVDRAQALRYVKGAMAAAVRPFPWARLLLALFFFQGILSAGLYFPSGAVGALYGLWSALAGIVVVVSVGVFVAQLGLFARPIVAADATKAGDRLALTFDDGPEVGATEEVLDLLRARGQRATFFVIGARAEAAPQLLERIVKEGHALGNHSYAHRHTTPFLPPAVLAAEIDRAEQLFARVRPGPARRWFRPPIGIVSPRVAQATRLARMEMISWTASARDGVRGASVDDALGRLRPHLRPGAILVLHDGAERGDRRPIAPAVLARLLDELDARGLRSVTLDELLD
jgi:peptidoglycan/xylan/chitin deacetylase (PgdA/CDA1 family)